MHKIYAYISAFLILATGVSFAHATTIFSHTDHNDSLGWISRGNWDVYSYVASSSLADIFNPITETTLWLAVSTGTLPVDSVSIYDGYSDGYQIEGGIGGNIQTNKDVITTTPQKIRFQGTSFPSSDFIHNYFRFSLGNFSAQYPTSTPGGGENLYFYGTDASSSPVYWSWQPQNAPWTVSPYVELLTDSTWTPPTSTNPDTVGISNNPLAQSSTTLSCERPSSWTDVGGGIAYGACVTLNFLFVAPDNSRGVQMFTNQLNISKTLFPFSLVFGLYDTASSTINSTIASSSQDLWLNLPQINVHIPLLTSTTLETAVGSSTKNMVFDIEQKIMWVATGLTALWIVL